METASLPTAEGAPSAGRYLVVMGVAGCGKSTIAALLAARLGWPFIEGDALHPARNIEKMRAGIALTDADRAPWLHAVAAAINTSRGQDSAAVISCSALRKSYREIIRGGLDDVCFVYLRGSRALFARRFAARQGHFMPLSLLDSQFATLEEPGSPELAMIIDAAMPPAEQVDAIMRSL